MIAPPIVQEIKRLLAGGKLSQRKIARLAGVSRGTVGAIAAGKRPDRAPLRRNGEGELLGPAGPLERCPGCGAMVFMPCRACRARVTAAGSPKPPAALPAVQIDETLELQLKPQHRARYEPLHARKIQEELGRRTHEEPTRRET